jgi:hypothetical protein
MVALSTGVFVCDKNGNKINDNRFSWERDSQYNWIGRILISSPVTTKKEDL